MSKRCVFTMSGSIFEILSHSIFNRHYVASGTSPFAKFPWSLLPLCITPLAGLGRELGVGERKKDGPRRLLTRSRLPSSLAELMERAWMCGSSR